MNMIIALIIAVFAFDAATVAFILGVAWVVRRDRRRRREADHLRPPVGPHPGPFPVQITPPPSRADRRLITYIEDAT